VRVAQLVSSLPPKGSQISPRLCAQNVLQLACGTRGGLKMSARKFSVKEFTLEKSKQNRRSAATRKRGRRSAAQWEWQIQAEGRRRGLFLHKNEPQMAPTRHRTKTNAPLYRAIKNGLPDFSALVEGVSYLFDAKCATMDRPSWPLPDELRIDKEEGHQARSLCDHMRHGGMAACRSCIFAACEKSCLVGISSLSSLGLKAVRCSERRRARSGRSWRNSW